MTQRLIRAGLVSPGQGVEQVRQALGELPELQWDPWWDRVLGIDAMVDDDPDLPRDCVPYLPCPLSTVMSMVEQMKVTASDVFVDVGAGIGRTLFAVHLLTGAGSIGLEIQPSLVRMARARAAYLNLSRARFIEGDAAELVSYITVGTVFFLYCPFGGSRLERFLDGLASTARARPIRVCCMHMGGLSRPWLRRIDSGTPELDVYYTD